MFDEVLSSTGLISANFQEGVRDSFGASIITDSLDPILNELQSLRHHSEEFNLQSIGIANVLEEARAIQITA
jgi:hypothetical protein